MGRRSRQRQKLAESTTGTVPSAPSAAGADSAPSTDYLDAEGNVLTLRGSLTAKTRTQYTRTLTGGFNREDAWQRAAELLFERLAVSWTIAGVELTSQKELLGRYRLASSDERRFIRDTLREHLQANFPELEAP